MKALILSVLALAFTMQASATCAARAGGKTVPSANYDRALPDHDTQAVKKPVQQPQQTATVRGHK